MAEYVKDTIKETRHTALHFLHHFVDWCKGSDAAAMLDCHAGLPCWTACSTISVVLVVVVCAVLWYAQA